MHVQDAATRPTLKPNRAATNPKKNQSNKAEPKAIAVDEITADEHDCAGTWPEAARIAPTRNAVSEEMPRTLALNVYWPDQMRTFQHDHIFSQFLREASHVCMSEDDLQEEYEEPELSKRRILMNSTIQDMQVLPSILLVYCM